MRADLTLSGPVKNQPFVSMVPSVSAKVKAPTKAGSTGDWSSSRSSWAVIPDRIAYFCYSLCSKF